MEKEYNGSDSVRFIPPTSRGGLLGVHDKHDRTALELIEQLQDYSLGEGIEILQTAIWWMILFNSVETADKEIEKGGVKGVVLTKKSK